MKQNDNESKDIVNRKNFVPENYFNHLIQNLSNPRFLGSIHLKKELNPSYSKVKDFIINQNELKMTRTLKKAMFNPITKILIISAIIFNIIWFLLIYFL
ncbi:MAG: hypothetical protein ACFFB0_10485 [Promethearchaeota archaeon]